MICAQKSQNQLPIKPDGPRTMKLAAVTQLATLSGVIPGLLFNPCAPKAAAVNPAAAG
jgi:hypothetical protein